jgi:hypothetical protein
VILFKYHHETDAAWPIDLILALVDPLACIFDRESRSFVCRWRFNDP